MPKITGKVSKRLKKYRANVKENRPAVHEARRQKSIEAARVSNKAKSEFKQLERNPELNPELIVHNGKLMNGLSNKTQKYLYESANKFQTMSRIEHGGMLNYAQNEIDRLKEIKEIAVEMEGVSSLNLLNLIEKWNTSKYIAKGKVKFGYTKNEELDSDTGLTALIAKKTVSVTVFLTKPPERFGSLGDPRLNKAARARIANPELSLLDAVLEGGFKFPMTTEKLKDKDYKDDNGVTM